MKFDPSKEGYCEKQKKIIDWSDPDEFEESKHSVPPLHVLKFPGGVEFDRPYRAALYDRLPGYDAQELVGTHGGSEIIVRENTYRPIVPSQEEWLAWRRAHPDYINTLADGEDGDGDSTMGGANPQTIAAQSVAATGAGLDRNQRERLPDWQWSMEIPVSAHTDFDMYMERWKRHFKFVLAKGAKEDRCHKAAAQLVSALIDEVSAQGYDSLFCLDLDVFAETLYSA